MLTKERIAEFADLLLDDMLEEAAGDREDLGALWRGIKEELDYRVPRA